LKLFYFLPFLAFFGFNFNGKASQVMKMDQNKFDYVSYGLLHKDELAITLHLWQGTKAPTLNTRLKPVPSAGTQPKIELPPEGKEKINQENLISVSLEFTNISSREIHIESRLWFTRLSVLANGKPVQYIGPSASLTSPEKKDFESLRPGEKFATDSVILNKYYRFADNFKGPLVITLQLVSQVPEAKATLLVN
jgi:hypothetical protein